MHIGSVELDFQMADPTEKRKVEKESQHLYVDEIYCNCSVFGITRLAVGQNLIHK